MSAGDHAAADDLITDGLDLPKNYFWMVFTQACAEVAAGVGNRAKCRKIFDGLSPYRGRIGVTGSGSGCFGLVSRTLGILALALDELETAEDLLIEAIEHAERIGAIFEAVSSRRLLAECYLAMGTYAGKDVASRIGEALGDSLMIAEKFGFAGEAQRMRNL